MATIHPYRGYLNTKFNIYSKGSEEISYNIFPHDTDSEDPIMSGSFLPNHPHSIQLNQPGHFSIKFDNGTSSTFTVEDGYKFGGSKVKKAYIFDKIPWCMVVMYDRTYFYNITTEECYVESISPDNIKVISKDFVIFENNNKSEISLYSLNEQKPILCFSDLIFFNEEAIIWKEDNTLITYSLDVKNIVHRIETSTFCLDTSNSRLLYAYNKKVLSCSLNGKFEISELFSCDGNLAALVENKLVIYTFQYDDYCKIQIHDITNPEFSKEIIIDGYIAKINDINLIDIEQHRILMNKLSLRNSDIHEAFLETQFSEIIFYPCNWDIYYIICETKFTKSDSDLSKKQEIHLRSINSEINQSFESIKNKSIVSETRFVLYNDTESFVKSHYKSSGGYIKGDRILVYKNKIIRASEGKVYFLSNNGYWDKCIECNYDFSKFEEYGIVKDEENNIYKSLFNNVYGEKYEYCFNPTCHIQIGESSILPSGKIYYKSWQLRKFSSQPNAVSPDLTKGLIIQHDKIYLLDISSRKEIRKQILSDIFDVSQYKDVILGEDGNQILYRNSRNTRVHNFQTGETFNFDNMSYIQQCNGIRTHFQRSGALQPRIVNPITGQMIDGILMKQYDFVSPDGTLYADSRLEKYVEYFYIESGEAISKEAYTDLYDKLKFPHQDKKMTEEWEIVRQSRIKFVRDHFQFLNKTYPKLFHNDLSSDNWSENAIGAKTGLDVSIFMRRVISRRGIAVIRETNSNKEVAHINLGVPLSFLNYVAFSIDSKYVSIAGFRDINNEFRIKLKGLFLIYDLQKNKMLCRHDVTRAVWITAFSKKGHVAAYTSDPNTIYFDENYNCISDIDFNKHIISGRNFLTFSPDGKLMALSKQGYIPMNDSIYWGHQPSTHVEVRNVDMPSQPILIFNDLSNNGIAKVKSSNIASVSFSNDNKRLMMVGEDGVVIIRNLHI